MTCTHFGTCATCGAVYDRPRHAISGGGSCNSCGAHLIDISNEKTTYSDDHKTLTWTATIKAASGHTINIPNDVTDYWCDQVQWGWVSHSHTNNLDGSITYKNVIKIKNSFQTSGKLYFQTKGSADGYSFAYFRFNTPGVYYGDITAPIQNDVAQKDQASANGWATIKQLTLTGTEDASDTIWLTIADKTTGEKYVTDAAVSVVDGKYSYICTPSIEGDANGRTYVVTAKDRIGNTSTKEFVISKTDGSYPQLKSGTSLTYTDWTTLKNISLSFFDFGAGGVEASLDNQTDYKPLTKDGEYYVWNHSFGNQVGTTEHTIYVRDALGNAGSYKLIVGNTDSNVYSINYNLNGGAMSVQKTSYTVADSFTLPTPTKTGYTFTGWTGSNGTAAQKTVTVNKGTYGNLTYSATWQSNIYQATFDAQGGKLVRSDYGLVQNDNGTVTANIIYDTTYFYLLGLTAKRDGYILKGFYDAPSGGVQVFKPDNQGGCIATKDGKYYDNNNVWKYAGNVTLYAQWEPVHYTIKYDANGGTGAMADQSITYEGYTKVRPNTFTKSGYTFGGWHASRIKDGVTQYLYTSTGSNWEWYDEGKQPSGYRLYLYRYDETTGRATTIDGDVITLHAQWTANVHKNRFWHFVQGFKNSEGNSANKKAYKVKEDSSVSFTYGQNYTIDASYATQIPNGYYLGSSFGSSWHAGTNGIWEPGDWLDYKMGTTILQADGSMFFEYDYYPYDYTITYNLNGGTNNSANPSTYNVLYGVSLKAPTRAGYTFTGWYDQNGNKITGINEGCNATFSSADDLYAKLAARITGNRTLTAHWSYNPVSVKVPQVLTGDHTGKSQFRVKCDDLKAGNIKVSVPSSFSYKQAGKVDIIASITAKSGNNIITPTNKVCVYNITTKNGLTAGCWQGSFNIGLTLTKK